MNRHSFLKACVTVSAFVGRPFVALSKVNRSKRVAKGFKVDAGKDRFGEPISLFEGDTFFTKVSTQDTAGDVYLFESICDKKGGPALHYHFEQDEFWYILEGEFLFQVGDQRLIAKKVTVSLAAHDTPCIC